MQFRVRIAGRMAILAGLCLVGVSMAGSPALAAVPAQPLLRPTPLVLKDGRIASVSIYRVPFAPGDTQVGTAARAIKAGEAGMMIAGGVESMSRAPFVMPKAESAYSRTNAVYDTTIGWRFVNRLMKEQYGVDSMPETAENVAADFGIERAAQDRMALASQLKAVTVESSSLMT